jgi:Domain of unknown function (DUF4386)
MHALIRTARTTGLFYLGLAISGVLGFVVIRSRLFAADDPAATLAHLVDNQSLARAGVALELLIVLTQALAAIWFYRLFRTADALAASGIAAFGLWLIPMGSCVLRSGWMPRPLGWVLVGGGIGYVLSAFIRYLAPEAQVVADALAYPATVGEFWIVIYLLAIGVRRRALDEAPRDAGKAAPAST